MRSNPLSLRDYPPFAAPYPDPGATLSDAQAQANLAYFLAVRHERLRVIGKLLAADAGIDAAAALAAPRQEAAALVAALHEWAGKRWPPLYEPRIARREVWLASRRSGPEIVYSLLLDVAILLGELIQGAVTEWRWAVSLDATDIKDGMASARRVVLLANAVGAAPAPFVIDIEAIVVNRWLQPANPTQQRLNLWWQVVEEAVTGKHQGWWLAQKP